ncbi:carboxypeptidase-like regulatory domain-containing protein [Sunxiuqinia sp. A32]|uniref:carboxypeptidase-like regulatory domain-containing protein n=1 Tax=Sunxiuqinia sp. A32 TaxID=3461496 RepID=UPI004045BE96
MRNTIILLILLTSFSVSAQTKLLKGRIVDSTSQDGIAYTNIGVEGTFYGTASDAEGFFELKIPDEFLSEMLYISAVGYKNETILLTELLKKDFNLIRLQAQSYDIENVDILAQSRVLFRVIKTAAERIPENYLAGPISSKIYYSESKQVTGGDAKNREAVVELYDENGYKNPTIVDAFSSRNFKMSQSKRNFDAYSFDTGSTGFDELLEMDIVRSANTLLNTKLINDYDLQLEGVSSFEGDSVWIISYKTDKLDLAHTGDYYTDKMTGKIYISKTDHAILRNECVIESSKNNAQNRSLYTKGNSETNVKYHFTSTYKKQNGKYALAYLDCNKTYLDSENKEVASIRKASILELSQKVSSIKGKDYFEDESYVESFWNSFERPF